MKVMEESYVEHNGSRSRDETEMDENQRNSIQVIKSGHPNDGASSPKSQDPDVDDQVELSRLKALATDVREQVDLERDVGRQVCYSIKFHVFCQPKRPCRRSSCSQNKPMKEIRGG